jgi:chemotaxis protein MotA
MDFATIIGLFLGVGLIGTGMYLGSVQQGVPISKFFEIVSLMIVLGGTLAATAIAFPLNEVKRVISLLRIVFSKSKHENLGPLVDEIVELSGVARKNMRDLEGSIPNIKEDFLKDGVQYVVDGRSQEDVAKILQTAEDFRYERESHESGLVKTMGIYAPAFGMVGTLIGLVMMLMGMGQASAEGTDMAASLGGAMGVALITTFYGALFANLIFLPFSDKLKMRNKENNLVSSIIIEGVLLIQQKKHPLDVRERLNVFLPFRDRKAEID